MTSKEGKAFLEDCLKKYHSDADINDCICYKTGNKTEAAAYQKDTIQTNVDWSKQKQKVMFVVKCFTHLGIYVAWPKGIGQESGTYIFYTKDLVAMENDHRCTFREIVIEDSEKAYIFRGEEGVKKFVENHLEPNLR